MQVEIDFEVYKALTNLRVSEGDSYNSVIRRLLKLPNRNALAEAARSPIHDGVPSALSRAAVQANALDQTVSRGRVLAAHTMHENALAPRSGAWFDNVFFPEGTEFRANYKGQTFTASISGGAWVSSDGLVRSSPSAAAGAISNTTVNGWRFWYFKRPVDVEWNRLDALKQ